MMGVSADYVHRDKFCWAGEEIRAGSARLKWCEVAPRETPVPEAIRAMARAVVEGMDAPGELGFVILHRCGASFYFLIVSTWLGNNEVWETVYAKKDDDDPGFALWPRPEPHLPTFCVWELGAVWAEVQAWKRYLTSSRDEAAKLAYLSDRFEGVV
jgi:hypothetical protein